MLWDIFCRVVDNYGDAGVCWRLCAGLAARGEPVRFWIDDPTVLEWMAPDGATGVEVHRWNAQTRWPQPGDVVVEAFEGAAAPEFIASFAALERCTGRKGLWIVLEYLSCEPYVERSHGLPSPVQHGPGAGLIRHFFYPGFTPRTGGLLREDDLLVRQARFDRALWLTQQGIAVDDAMLVSLLCYEPAALPQLLVQLAQHEPAVMLVVAAGRGTGATRAALALLDANTPHWNAQRRLRTHFLPFVSQHEYDHLLWACDCNFIRGEDSWVRAIWAGKPFVWCPYPQAGAAHRVKLDAFLDLAQASDAWRAFHHAWSDSARLPAFRPGEWAAAGSALRERLLGQDALMSRLLAFASEKADGIGSRLSA